MIQSIQIILVVIVAAACVGVQAQLTADSVSEGPCRSDVVQNGAQNVNLIWFLGMRNYYVPIASEACYRGYAEVLLGRPAQTQAEIDAMKLRIKAVLPIPPSFVSYGYEDPNNPNSTKKIAQACPPVGLNQILCLPVKALGSPGTNTSSISTSEDTVYYTDNETTILITRCLNGKVRDYKVLTTGPTVSDSMRATLLAKITEQGFDPNKMKTHTY